jgi:hypothetical protein
VEEQWLAAVVTRAEKCPQEKAALRLPLAEPRKYPQGQASLRLLQAERQLVAEKHRRGKASSHL